VSTLLQRLPVLPFGRVVVVLVLLAIAAGMALLATPRLVAVENAPSLEATVPRAFGEWRELPTPLLQVGVLAGTEANMDQPYDQTVMRTYVNGQGVQVQLALAWGRKQRQEIKIHRPDLCYVAQGWRVVSLVSRRMSGIQYAPSEISGKRMLVAAGNSYDAVSYWMRIGGVFSEDAWVTRMHILREGLAGRIPDGILVRASVRVGSPEDATRGWEISERFLQDLSRAVSPATAAMLVGPATTPAMR
jgi:EpsI family protein